jgi:hypothetical protein
VGCGCWCWWGYDGDRGATVTVTRGGVVCWVAGCYIINQGSLCPLVIPNPFGRELLLLDGSIGFKRST